MSLVHRILQFSFALTGTGASSGPTTATSNQPSFGGQGGGSGVAGVAGLRAKADIVVVGGEATNTLEARIYGMTLSEMNALSTIGTVPGNYTNKVTVKAGSSAGDMVVVYIGDIRNAFVDAQNMPDVAFHVTANSGLRPAMTTIPPTTHKGPFDGAKIMASLAGQAGYQFENNGVSVLLSNPYFPSTIREQMLACIKAMGCEWNGVTQEKVAIWPADKARQGDGVVISPPPGLMVDYPAFTENGVLVKVLFNAQLAAALDVGKSFTVQGSSITNANGQWKVATLAYSLESETPNGNWFMILTGVKAGTSGVGV